jgi:hypothetical protein
LEESLPGWCGRIGALLVKVQVDSLRMDFGQETNQVVETSAQAIHLPRRDHIDLASHSRVQ